MADFSFPSAEAAPRHDWTREEIAGIVAAPFIDLVFRAQAIHRGRFNPSQVQLSTLLSIKTGGCPEDCGYCAQSAHFDSGVKSGKLMSLDAVLADADRARAGGATRYCMGAAWRNPRDSDLEKVCAMVEGVRALGMETCATLGMLTVTQSARLKDAGLDYYNHNIDTSEEYYGKVVTTRTYADRLDTLANVRDAGIKVCCGGIIGMGEAREDRVGMLHTLATLPQHPESVPINLLARIQGTPLGNSDRLESFELIRTIAAARITMPDSMVRLSAGRESLTDEAQALCFLAGANSIFVGNKLLTTTNPELDRDRKLFDSLNLEPMPAEGKQKQAT
jgi:biotin synthase